MIRGSKGGVHWQWTLLHSTHILGEVKPLLTYETINLSDTRKSTSRNVPSATVFVPGILINGSEVPFQIFSGVAYEIPELENSAVIDFSFLGGFTSPRSQVHTKLDVVVLFQKLHFFYALLKSQLLLL